LRQHNARWTVGMGGRTGSAFFVFQMARGKIASKKRGGMAISALTTPFLAVW